MSKINWGTKLKTNQTKTIIGGHPHNININREETEEVGETWEGRMRSPSTRWEGKSTGDDFCTMGAGKSVLGSAIRREAKANSR